METKHNVNAAVLNLPDEMLHLSLMGGEARALLCRTTAAANKMAKIHQPSDVCLAAMSRLMTATLMLGVQMKDKEASVTVTVAGNGPGGKMTCVAHGCEAKVTMANPQTELPLKKDGHLDVGGLVGHEGRLTVVKDLGMKEPYVGQIPLVSGELAEDFASYYTVSEQQPSLVSLGCLAYQGQCLSAGGILVQAMPGCSEETLQMLENRSPFFYYISREVADMPLKQLADTWFEGMDMKLLSVDQLSCRCDCSREKMEKALIALGRDQLQSMIDEDGQAELTCHFCRTSHHFDKDQLQKLLFDATH